MTDLNSRMEFGHVIRVNSDGTVDDVNDVHAPEVYAETDEDGQILTDDDMIARTEQQGWIMLSGYTRQWQYSGPIMHPSEFIGDAIETDIMERPGLYVAVAVETLDDSESAAGWSLCYKPA